MPTAISLRFSVTLERPNGSSDYTLPPQLLRTLLANLGRVLLYIVGSAGSEISILCVLINEYVVVQMYSTDITTLDFLMQNYIHHVSPVKGIHNKFKLYSIVSCVHC